ncbi:hypothetical protein CDD81_6530 [Ophiocordyceps australis]|uniref:Chromatin modification-related protein n=1 Tax=Ophiocordyceps australis TaxID=1399860 RepID=A0A2C5YGF5_9HYPO|nr:hypothetical protein CDD81_6530 [Ophiocordyceps australis]
MKSAKAPSVDGPALRRSQPVRQTRTNPPRSSAMVPRSGGRDTAGARPQGDQPIEIYPAITHFADIMSALPKDLVRHFTLLKEVDAKIFAPEEQLFKLVTAINDCPVPEARANNSSTSLGQPSSAPMSAQNSSTGTTMSQSGQPTAPSTEDEVFMSNNVYDASNIPRRQLFRQTALKIQEMLVALEEKNHVLCTANEALQRQLARVEDVWPFLENEFSEEAKWGSTTHWAYPENRVNKVSHSERVRRDGAAAISAAAQALADEAAARSDARKQAVQAKRNQKNQHHDSDADDHEGRHRGEGGKKTQGSKARKAADTNLGLGISGPSANGHPPSKRRRVDKSATNGTAAAERALGAAPNHATKTRTSSPRTTPAPDATRKRKALPSSSSQAKKKNGTSLASPKLASSPVMTSLPEARVQAVPCPISTNVPRPASSRARRNSASSNAENGRARAASSAPHRPNGNVSNTVDLASTSVLPRTSNEARASKESSAPARSEPTKKEADRIENMSISIAGSVKRDSRGEEADRKSESLPPQPQSAGIVTKSGRASKPSTPALAALELARPRSSRNADNGGGGKKMQKKSNSLAQTLALSTAEDDANSSMQGEDDEEGDIDADEPTYCYCNSVSYGEMVACDADGCEREWFHLACVGLKVAPGSKTKWYCEDCKERLKASNKKAGSR